MDEIETKKKYGLNNLSFLFQCFFLKKPPFLHLVEGNGVEGIWLKNKFFQNFVERCYFDKLLYFNIKKVQLTQKNA